VNDRPSLFCKSSVTVNITGTTNRLSAVEASRPNPVKIGKSAAGAKKKKARS
jgi:hypothetical protein